MVRCVTWGVGCSGMGSGFLVSFLIERRVWDQHLFEVDEQLQRGKRPPLHVSSSVPAAYGSSYFFTA